MIGILLLIVALFYYFKPQKRWISYFLYASFMLNGFCLLTDSVIGFKNADMAVIYTFIISLTNSVNELIESIFHTLPPIKPTGELPFLAPVHERRGSDKDSRCPASYSFFNLSMIL